MWENCPNCQYGKLGKGYKGYECHDCDWHEGIGYQDGYLQDGYPKYGIKDEYYGKIKINHDELARLRDEIQLIENREYRALKRAEKAEKQVAAHAQELTELKNETTMKNSTNTADTLRHAILNDSDAYTRRTAVEALKELEKSPPHDLDNSMVMDLPEEIREAAKRAGLGLEDLADLILTIKREDREHKRQAQMDTYQDENDKFENSLKSLQHNHENQKTTNAHQLEVQRICNTQSFENQKLNNVHEQALAKIKNQDNINKREMKIKIAEIKAGVKIKNKHGRSVGEDRWNAVQSVASNVGSSARWVAAAGGLSYIAYVVSQIFLI